MTKHPQTTRSPERVRALDSSLEKLNIIRLDNGRILTGKEVRRLADEYRSALRIAMGFSLDRLEFWSHTAHSYPEDAPSCRRLVMHLRHGWDLYGLHLRLDACDAALLNALPQAEWLSGKLPMKSARGVTKLGWRVHENEACEQIAPKSGRKIS